MHGEKEMSSAPRVICTLIHASFLGIAAWIYFGGGIESIQIFLGIETAESGNTLRRLVLLLFGIVIFVRMYITLFYFLKRSFDWSEFGGVMFALFLYQVVFALLGGGEKNPLDFIDYGAIAVFVIGSYLNTGAELQRHRFKANQENQGVLYTQGLFRYARHINYFGDSLWVTAWAVLTRNIWSYIIPVWLTAMFIFFFIPALTKHLRARYGKEYEEWSHTTKAFIPFVY